MCLLVSNCMKNKSLNSDQSEYLSETMSSAMSNNLSYSLTYTLLTQGATNFKSFTNNNAIPYSCKSFFHLIINDYD